MSYSIFLDDERHPQDVTWVSLPLHNYIIVRNYDEFTRLINANGCPKFCSFDHDLAAEHYNKYFDAVEDDTPLNYTEFKEKTGFECAKFLIEYCSKRGLPFPEYEVHSMNIIGKKNIVSLIESYKKSLLY